MKNDFDYIKHINFIKYFYAFQSAFILFLLLVLIGGTSEFSNRYSVLEGLISFSISIGIFYGIKTSKGWVVILVLLISYWGIIDSFLVILNGETEFLEKLVSRTLAIVQFVFEIYEIKIFSKIETKRYFKERGVTLIT